MIFKDYDGNPIDTPTHTHSIEDTKRNVNIALASKDHDGFMPKEYKDKLDKLSNKVTIMSSKIKGAVFMNTKS